MRKAHFLTATILLGLVFITSGCASSGLNGIACNNHADCPAEQACMEGYCQTLPACVTDEDCSFGSYCLSGNCTAANPCSSWKDCPEENTDCIDGYCRPMEIEPGCLSDADCEADQYCDLMTQSCRLKGSDQGSTDCVLDQECLSGYYCDTELGICLPDSDPDGDVPQPDGDIPSDTDGDSTTDGDEPIDGDDAPINYGNLCKPCVVDSDCNNTGSDLCLEDQSGQKFCGRICSDTDPCPPEYFCAFIGGAANEQCLPTNGYCSEVQTDGDQAVDGDAGGPCSGGCVTGAYNDICYGDQLCVCANDSFSLTDCTDICAGQGAYDHCGYSTVIHMDKCFCEGDADGDDPSGVCEGFTGTDIQGCCKNNDPCDYGDDGFCDCDTFCDWDRTDCLDDIPCPGYTGSNDLCCNLGNWCSYDNDGTCDCGGTCDWEVGDCGGNQGEVCPGYEGLDPCCYTDDPCEKAGDGACACDGACGWDSVDCTFCDGYTGSSNCCKPSDPCGYKRNNICDCDDTCSWDDRDCSQSGIGVHCGACPCSAGHTCLEYTNFATTFCAQNCNNGENCPAGSTCDGVWCIPDITQAFCLDAGNLQMIDACSSVLDIECAAGKVCQGGACVPEVADGDLGPDGDIAYEGELPLECAGSCSDEYPYTCFGDELCLCENGQLTMQDCLSLCTENGFETYVECSYSASSEMDVCYCSDPAGTCTAPIQIRSLPFSDSNSTAGAGSNLETDMCGLLDGTGPEKVYLFEAVADQSVNFSVTPETSGFDIQLAIRTDCSNNPDQCLGSDDYSNGGEEITITFNVAGSYWITVDGYQGGDSGSYTLTATDIGK